MANKKTNENEKPVDVDVFEVDPKFNPPVAGAGVDAAIVFPKENVPPLGAADATAGVDPKLKLEALKAEDQFRGLNIIHAVPPSIHIIVPCFPFSLLGSSSTPVPSTKEIKKTLSHKLFQLVLATQTLSLTNYGITTNPNPNPTT